MTSSTNEDYSDKKFTKFNQNLAVLFENQENVDFHFKFEDEEDGQAQVLGVHNLVLSTVSECFNLMLNGPMKEKSPLTIKDFSCKTFKKMLKLAYGKDEKFESLEETCEVYRAAHMYEMTRPLEFARKQLLKEIAAKHEVEEIYHYAKVFDDQMVTNSCLKLLHSEIQDFVCHHKYEGSLLEKNEDKNFKKIKGILNKTLQVIGKTESLKLRIARNLGLLYSLVGIAYQVATNILMEKTLLIFPRTTTSIKSYPTARAARKLLPELKKSVPKKKSKTMFYFKFTKKDKKNFVWLHTHQNAIKPKSAVLKTILEESEDNEEEILDVSLEVFQKLINQMYNIFPKFENLEEVLEYFCAAEKYEYQEGIIVAENHIAEKLKEENIGFIYDYALKNHSQGLVGICTVKFMGDVYAKLEEMFRTKNHENLNCAFEVPIILDKVLKEALEALKTEENVQKKINQGLELYKIVMDGMFAAANQNFSSAHLSLSFRIEVVRTQNENEYQHLVEYWKEEQSDESESESPSND